MINWFDNKNLNQLSAFVGSDSTITKMQYVQFKDITSISSTFVTIIWVELTCFAFTILVVPWKEVRKIVLGAVHLVRSDRIEHFPIWQKNTGQLCYYCSKYGKCSWLTFVATINAIVLKNSTKFNSYFS